MPEKSIKIKNLDFEIRSNEMLDPLLSTPLFSHRRLKNNSHPLITITIIGIINSDHISFLSKINSVPPLLFNFFHLWSWFDFTFFHLHFSDQTIHSLIINIKPRSRRRRRRSSSSLTFTSTVSYVLSMLFLLIFHSFSCYHSDSSPLL